jgi:hypothetical protein
MYVLYYYKYDILAIIKSILLMIDIWKYIKMVPVISLDELNGELKLLNNDISTCILLFHGNNTGFRLNKTEFVDDLDINPEYFGKLILFSCSTGISLFSFSRKIQLKYKKLLVISPTIDVCLIDMVYDNMTDTITFGKHTRYGYDENDLYDRTFEFKIDTFKVKV